MCGDYPKLYKETCSVNKVTRSYTISLRKTINWVDNTYH